eukprot:354275-Chlamydomonas_euryale.AAC.1
MAASCTHPPDSTHQGGKRPASALQLPLINAAWCASPPSSTHQGSAQQAPSSCHPPRPHDPLRLSAKLLPPPPPVCRYVNNTGLSARVGALNPAWNEEQSSATLDARFLKAVELTGGEFRDAVQWVGNVWLPARAHVKAALQAMPSVDPSCQIMRLDTVCPWKEHLYDLENEMGLAKPVLFCLFEDTREKKWRIQVCRACGMRAGL